MLDFNFFSIFKLFHYADKKRDKSNPESLPMSVGDKIAETSHSIESQKIIAGEEVKNVTENVLNDDAVKKRKHRKRSKGGMLV